MSEILDDLSETLLIRETELTIIFFANSLKDLNLKVKSFSVYENVNKETIFFKYIIHAVKF